MYYKSDKVYASKQFADYDIARETVIHTGDAVKLSGGKIVKVNDNGSEKPIGIADESHYGADYALELQCKKTKISVLDSPTALFAAKGIVLTAASDQSGKLVPTGALSYTASAYVGSMIKCISANPESACKAGEVYKVTANGTGDITFGKNTKAGDVFKIYPQNGCVKLGYDDGKLKLSDTGAHTQVVDTNVDGDEIVFKFA